MSYIHSTLFYTSANEKHKYMPPIDSPVTPVMSHTASSHLAFGSSFSELIFTFTFFFKPPGIFNDDNYPAQQKCIITSVLNHEDKLCTDNKVHNKWGSSAIVRKEKTKSWGSLLRLSLSPFWKCFAKSSVLIIIFLLSNLNMTALMITVLVKTSSPQQNNRSSVPLLLRRLSTPEDCV